MATWPQRIVLTYQDYLELPSDGKRYEILEGELYMSAAPNTAHQKVSMGLSRHVGDHVEARGLGQLFAAPCDVLLSDISIVQPDLVFVASGHESIILPAHIRGVPDLVVEITSPSTTITDRHAKMQVYARHGVPHYWIFHPTERRAEGYELAGEGYRQVAAAEDEASFAAPPFLDLVIPLGKLWS